MVFYLSPISLSFRYINSLNPYISFILSSTILINLDTYIYLSSSSPSYSPWVSGFCYFFCSIYFNKYYISSYNCLFFCYKSLNSFILYYSFSFKFNMLFYNSYFTLSSLSFLSDPWLVIIFNLSFSSFNSCFNPLFLLVSPDFYCFAIASSCRASSSSLLDTLWDYLSVTL